MAATFATEQRVRVRGDRPPGHLRTPWYCRGKVGTVERLLGEFLNPEEEGYGRAHGQRRALYRVRFGMGDLWPDYAGPAHDTVEVEIFEHWMEPFTEVRHEPATPRP
jgi:nitrile hydratase